MLLLVGIEGLNGMTPRTITVGNIWHRRCSYSAASLIASVGY